MKELTVPALTAELEKVLDFINEELERNDCSNKIKIQIAIAVEEIFVNIANYAYNPNIGDATIKISIGGEPLQVTIQFFDLGKPYNPLENEEPDITKSADERDIGGLGILMVKKSMDDVQYQYIDGMNILTINKRL